MKNIYVSQIYDFLLDLKEANKDNPQKLGMIDFLIQIVERDGDDFIESNGFREEDRIKTLLEENREMKRRLVHLEEDVPEAYQNENKTYQEALKNLTDFVSKATEEEKRELDYLIRENRLLHITFTALSDVFVNSGVEASGDFAQDILNLSGKLSMKQSKDYAGNSSKQGSGSLNSSTPISDLINSGFLTEEQKKELEQFNIPKEMEEELWGQAMEMASKILFKNK